MRAALALLITGGVAIAAGILGFQAGVASNIGAAGGTVVLGGGLGVFGLFLFMGFLFFSFLVLAAILGGRRHRHGGWGHHGPMGPGGNGDPRRAWVAEVHRTLHEEEANAAGRTPGATSGVGA
jgi:hypothetical protein